MLAEQLRAVTEAGLTPIPTQSTEEVHFRNMVYRAFEAMKVSALEQRRDAVVLEIYPYQVKWIDLESADDLTQVPVDRLTGMAAMLRDKLAAQNLRMQLRYRVRGDAANTRHIVYDLVATW